MKDFVLGDEIHHGTARSKRAERQTATDGFGQADDVWLDTEKFAGAAPGEFRAGFYFVEDEQRAAPARNVAQTLKETRLGHTQTHVHQDGLENDGGDLAGIFLEAALNARKIVEGGNNNVGERGFRNAGATGNARGRVGIAVVFSLGLHADERGVVQAVVGALEFEDFVTPGSGACEAAGVHGDFGAAGTKAHHLDGITFADFFREFPFLIVRHAKRGAAMQFLFHGFDHSGMAVAGHQRAETQVVINIFVAVEVVDFAALSVFHEERIRLVMAVVAGNAQRNPLEGALVRRGGFRRALLVGGKFLFECVVHTSSVDGRSVPCGQFHAVNIISRVRRRSPREPRLVKNWSLFASLERQS